MAKIWQVGKVGIGLLGFVVVIGLTFAQADEGSVIEQRVGELTATAQNYQASGQYAEAEQIHRDIIRKYPDSDHALAAQKNLVLLFINSGNAYVQEEVAALTGYAENAKLATEVYDIANHYWGLVKDAEAWQLYQYLADQLPVGKFAFGERGWFIGVNIKLDNYAAAEAGIKALIADFGGHPELGDMLYRLGDEYWGQRKYAEAQQLYQYIAEQLPDDEFALRGRGWAIGADIKMGNYTLAEEGIEALITDFAGHPELAGMLYQLGNNYWDLGRYKWNPEKYEEARQLYRYFQYFAKQLPADKFTFSERGWFIGTDIKLGNYTAAEAGIEALVADFGNHPQLYDVLYQLGNDYRAMKEYESALWLYQHIADNCPYKGGVLQGHVGVRIAHIRLNDDPNEAQATTAVNEARVTTAVVDMLIKEFDDVPRVDWGVFVIGEDYHRLGKEMKERGLVELSDEYHRKAIKVWRRVIDDLGESKHAAYAWYFSGVAYIRLKEYKETVSHFEVLVERWPNWMYAWSAQHLIGTYTNILMKDGKISPEEAEPKIEAAWLAMIDNYKGKPLYNHSLRKLGRFYLERGQAEKGIVYLKAFCEGYPGHPMRAKAMYELAGAYEEIGEPALAKERYEEFLRDHPDNKLVDEAENRLAELRGAN